MKRFGIIMMFVAMFATTSCGTLTSATDATAAAAGATCGKALLSLNNSKKAGTLSITNPTDLSNMLIVINAYNGLKANKENASYKKSFTTGMVTGGSGAITTNMATNLTNSLLNATGLDGVNTTNITQKAQTVSTIIQLLGALNQ
ncbi:MAG: hypothetical protein K5842_04055 [Bacteroidales bacterium]|nr:hypothetical protein [Bacteroidales bacterium]